MKRLPDFEFGRFSTSHAKRNERHSSRNHQYFASLYVRSFAVCRRKKNLHLIKRYGICAFFATTTFGFNLYRNSSRPAAPPARITSSPPSAESFGIGNTSDT